MLHIYTIDLEMHISTKQFLVWYKQVSPLGLGFKSVNRLMLYKSAYVFYDSFWDLLTLRMLYVISHYRFLII